MIDPNILNILKSNMDDPSYSILIKKITQKELCNKDKLNITIEQVSPNMYKIIENQNAIIENKNSIIENKNSIITSKNSVIEALKQTLTDNNIDLPIELENDADSTTDLEEEIEPYQLSINNIVEKTFSIESALGFDNSLSMFTSNLTGNMENEFNIPTPSTTMQGNIRHFKLYSNENDTFSYLDSTNFIIKKTQMTVNIPDAIDVFSVILSHPDLHTYYNNEKIIIPFADLTFNSTDNKLTIDLDDVINDLIQQNIDHSATTIIDQITELQESLDNEDLTEEEIAEINNQISELESQENDISNRNNKIINTIQTLNFSSDTQFSIKANYTIQKDISQRYIETVSFTLASKIDIDFIQTYKKIPSVVLTVDQIDKIYSSYDLEFKKDENNNFIGVIITFNNLKRQKEYNDVNALIIGDVID